MDRRRIASLGVLALVAIGAFLLLVQRDDASDSGCDRIRLASARANQLAEPGRPPPSSDEYREEARAVRLVAIEAPTSVRNSVEGMADALGLLASHLTGFDPDDRSSYAIVEERTAEIEQAQTQLDRATADIDRWSSRTCA